ncbi:ribosomal protein L13, archaeal/eukaryotic [Thermoplasmatales archaeon BRNA1]|nr:ribosomal protein L13, archaeal/eukaryotic [Thermoplasmatales archaeon BRNA1]
MVTVIDGAGLIYGRLGTQVANMIMSGEEVVVLNAEKIIVTGERAEVLKDFKHKVDLGEVTKRKGPFYPRRADLLFKRCVRGMIPRYTTTGREAYRALHVFVGVPKQFENAEKIVPEVASKHVNCKFVTLGEISEFLGSKVN